MSQSSGKLHEHGAGNSSRFGKVRGSTRVLDCLFDDLFDLIPVLGVNALDVAAEVLLDLAEHLPFSAAGDEGDGHTNATEPTGTTDTVQVGLVVGLNSTSLLVDQLRNVLEQSVTLSAEKTSRKVGQHT